MVLSRVLGGIPGVGSKVVCSAQQYVPKEAFFLIRNNSNPGRLGCSVHKGIIFDDVYCIVINFGSLIG